MVKEGTLLFLNLKTPTPHNEQHNDGRRARNIPITLIMIVTEGTILGKKKIHQALHLYLETPAPFLAMTCIQN
jgi:hypothetical protein